MIDQDIKKDFPIFKNYAKNNSGSKLLYFDNSATTLKPKIVIEAVTNYYSNYSANVHRGDYKLAYMSDCAYQDSRRAVADFINADFKEVFFNSGTTAGINSIIDMLDQQFQAGDEIITTYNEHASLIAPLIMFANKKKLKLRYLKLDQNLRVTYQSFLALVNNKTKLIALAQISNTIGDVRPIKEIAQYARKHEIITLIDGAQSAPHMAINVKDLAIDFFVFSAHKLLGPTGIGAVYFDWQILSKLFLKTSGGGALYEINNQELIFKDAPYCFESGTPNIAGAIGFGAAVKYLQKIKMINIWKHDQELKRYAISQLKKLTNVVIYNANSLSGIVLFNVKGVFAQDVASQLSSHDICVRSGDHCAKLLTVTTGEKTYVRLSTYIYNTKLEIDKVVNAIANGGDFLDGFFAV